MRLKLVIGASSLAAIVGAGLCIAALVLFFSSVQLFSYPSLLLVSTFFLPTAAIVFASIFVYRHTSRRRKLQAFMTVVLATTLTIAFLVLASILSARREEPPAPTSPIAQNVRYALACRLDVRYALACRQGALCSTSFSNCAAGVPERS